MIKFFRKIRYELLSKNKATKYFVYAFGEILLVVIGILIALQINSWNQKRLDSAKEKLYLSNLQKEVNENSILNQILILDRMDDKIESLKLAKAFCENVIEIQDTLELLNKITYGGVFGGGHPMGVRNYYDELLNTGNLQLIKNDSLKNAVADYYSRVEYYKLRSTNYATKFSNYNDSLRPFIRENASHISRYDQIEMLKAFKSEEFRRLVDGELSYAYAVYNGARNLDSRANEISELIDAELGDLE